MPSKFTAHGRLGALTDVQKTFMWELMIPTGNIAGLVMEDMTIRCRNVQIPGRTIDPIISYFMGTKQHHTGLTNYTGTFTTQFEEYEDQTISININEWMEHIFNYTEGHSESTTGKAGYMATLKLMMYDSAGNKLPKMIEYFNCWPTSIADVSMDYASADSVKYDVTWQYDFWRLVDSSK